MVRELARHRVAVEDGQLLKLDPAEAKRPLVVSPSADVWKIQAVGSTISGYQNGKLVVQATDTNINSGSPGVWLYYSSNQIDNWSGGDVTAPPPIRWAVRSRACPGRWCCRTTAAMTSASRPAARSPSRPGCRRLGLQRDGEDQPGRADLLGGQRVGHGRVGEHHQRRRHLRDARPPTRWAVRSRGCPGRWCCRTTAAMTSASRPAARSPSRTELTAARPTA